MQWLSWRRRQGGLLSPKRTFSKYCWWYSSAAPNVAPAGIAVTIGRRKRPARLETFLRRGRCGLPALPAVVEVDYRIAYCVPAVRPLPIRRCSGHGSPRKRPSNCLRTKHGPGRSRPRPPPRVRCDRCTRSRTKLGFSSQPPDVADRCPSHAGNPSGKRRLDSPETAGAEGPPLPVLLLPNDQRISTPALLLVPRGPTSYKSQPSQRRVSWKRAQPAVRSDGTGTAIPRAGAVGGGVARRGTGVS